MLIDFEGFNLVLQDGDTWLLLQLCIDSRNDGVVFNDLAHGRLLEGDHLSVLIHFDSVDGSSAVLLRPDTQ